MASVRAQLLTSDARPKGISRCFDYTFPGTNFPAGAIVRRKFISSHTFFVILSGILAATTGGCFAAGQSTPQGGASCCSTPTKGKGNAALTSKKRTKTDAATRRFTERVDALLASAPVSKGDWGLLVVDAETGSTLYELNADRYFIPASNMKLFTTALALAKLGPDFRFHTTLETHGVVSSEGKLSGDLFLVGRGDPNLSNRKFPYEFKEEFDGQPEKVLAELADALVAAGVKEISGNIVADDSYFPREPYPSGWEIDDMVWEYGAAISAIVVDDNTVALTLMPGDLAGDAVQASVVPATPDFVVENNVVTSAADAKSELTLTREPGSRSVALRGSLPARSLPRKLILAMHEPAEHAAALLSRLLAERGVKVDGLPRAVHSPEPATATPRVVLAEHVSVPLSDSVKLINKISQNLHTEMLLRATARQSGTWNTPEELMKFPADFYAAAGIDPDDIVQRDGSGLSRHDLVTARAIVQLLKFAQNQSWFTPFYDSLPVAGTDGTLEPLMKNTAAASHIHAKTGSLEHVRTRSGYADTLNGRRLIFSFLSNNQGGKNHEALDTLDALCVAMVEEFDHKPAVQREARQRTNAIEKP
jgi:serine-type D-Ala-D-Ala carboxypeptidase/endopeptidase (penicillin-binding protein 4)